MASLAELIVTLGLDASQYDSGLASTAQSTDKFASSAQTQLAGLAAGGIAAIGVAMVATAGTAINFASETNSALNDIQATLGTTEQETQALGETVRAVFANNFGSSIGDVGQAVATVQSQFDGLGVSVGDDLQGITENAFRLRDVFDIDIANSTNAVAVLMQDFGLTSEQAFDFITAGAQQGLNSSGDLLETITEYSTQFSNGGATADQFFSILETGLGSGVLGTDKAADAFKEFLVRINDGSTATSEGLALLGIDSQQLLAEMGAGTVTAADAFNLVLESLQGVDDKNILMQAGVALLGTQFEDLGADAVLALDLSATSLGDLAGATDSLNVKYNDLGSVASTVWRQFLLAIEPVGAKILELANLALPYVLAAFENLRVNIPLAFAWLQTNVAPIVNSLIVGFQNILTQAQPFISFVQANLTPILAGLGAMILAVVVPAFVSWAVAAGAAAIATITAMLPVLIPIALIGAAVGLLTAAWQNNWGDIQGKTAVAIEFITGVLNNAKIGLDFLIAAASNMATQVIGFFEGLRDGTINPMQSIQSFLLSVWDSIYSNTIGEVVAMWQGVIGQFAAAHPETVGRLEKIKAGLEILWAALVVRVTTVVTELWTTISAKFEEGRGFVTTKTEEITTFVVTKFQELVAPAVKAWEDIRSAIAEKLAETQEFINSKFEEIRSFIEGLGSRFLVAARGLAQSIIDGLIQGIGNGIAAVTNAVADLVQGGIDAAMNALGAHSPSDRFIEVGETVPQGLAIGIERNNTVSDATEQMIGEAITVANQSLKGIPTSLGNAFSSGVLVAGKELTRLPDLVLQVGQQAGNAFSLGLGAIQTIADTELGDMSGNVISPTAEIGDNIIDTLDNSINDGAGTIKDALSDLAKEALQGAKDELGISSPSQEFIGVAREIMNGLLYVWRFAPELQNALSVIMTQGLDKATESALQGLEQLNSASVEAIRKIQGTFQKLQIDELTGSLDLAKTRMGLLDTVAGMKQPISTESTADLQAEWEAIRFEMVELENQSAKIEGQWNKIWSEVDSQKGLVAQLQNVEAINEQVKDQEELVGKLPQGSAEQATALKELHDLWAQQADLVNALPVGVGKLSEEEKKLTDLLKTQEELRLAGNEAATKHNELAGDKTTLEEQIRLEEERLKKQEETRQKLNAVAEQLEKDLASLTAKTNEQAKIDPMGASNFYKMRSAQLVEMAQEQQNLLKASNEEERKLALAKIAELENVQKLELAVFEQQQKERQAQLAKDAADMRALGENIGQGFADSLADSLLGINGVMAVAMRSMIESVKQELGIASPSKVFGSIAANTIKSFIDTAEGGLGDLYATGQAVGQAYTAGANPELNSPGGYVTGLASQNSGPTFIYQLDLRGSNLTEDQVRRIIEETQMEALNAGYYRSLATEG